MSVILASGNPRSSEVARMSVPAVLAATSQHPAVLAAYSEAGRPSQAVTCTTSLNNELVPSVSSGHRKRDMHKRKNVDVSCFFF